MLTMTTLVQAAPMPIKVGILLSRTGGMADIGAEGEHGFELALQQLKSKFTNDKYEATFVFEDFHGVLRILQLPLSTS